MELTTDAPLSLVLGNDGFVFSTSRLTRLTIRLDTEPREVLVQGSIVRDWIYESEGELSLLLPEASSFDEGRGGAT